MKKMNKKYITLALVALLAIGGVFVYNQHDNLSTVVFNKQVEPALARIDLSAPYTKEAQFTVYDANEQPLQEASWMEKFGSRGYLIQQESTGTSFVIHANNDSEIKLVLRGPDKRDENNQSIESWVDFTSLTINGEEILDEEVAVWHNKPFAYTISAKADETYNVVAKWQKHEDTEIVE